ncbi:MAG TPA: ACP phosphodiesterase [Puia sp.]|nr:ACP phosphodiesterase [Puia sp.]
MNYLAHAYLSFRQPEILVGNLISDFVKGKKKEEYPELIRKGIQLHRLIDQYTDNHEATMRAKAFFRPACGLYAGAFIDIVYDHFLANDTKEFPQHSLAEFSQYTYQQMQPFEAVFPEKFSRMFYYMKLQDWLFNYQFRKGVQNSFAGLVRRAKYLNHYQPAFEAFETNYAALNDCYQVFFPDIRDYAYQQLIQWRIIVNTNPG